MEQLKNPPAYLFRLPDATYRRRFSAILMAFLGRGSSKALVIL